MNVNKYARKSCVRLGRSTFFLFLLLLLFIRFYHMGACPLVVLFSCGKERQKGERRSGTPPTTHYIIMRDECDYHSLSLQTWRNECMHRNGPSGQWPVTCLGWSKMYRHAHTHRDNKFCLARISTSGYLHKTTTSLVLLPPTPNTAHPPAASSCPASPPRHKPLLPLPLPLPPPPYTRPPPPASPCPPHHRPWPQQGAAGRGAAAAAGRRALGGPARPWRGWRWRARRAPARRPPGSASRPRSCVLGRMGGEESGKWAGKEEGSHSQHERDREMGGVPKGLDSRDDEHGLGVPAHEHDLLWVAHVQLRRCGGGERG